MATETLTCQVGKPHKFTRERTRGRKPTVCPKHKEMGVAKVVTPKPITSKVPASVPSKVIKAGKVSAIPKVKAPVPAVTAPKTVTLHCVTGNHDWQRASQRGRKPINCPEHAVSQSQPRSSSHPESGKSGAGKASQPAAQAGSMGTVTDLQEYRMKRDAADAIREAKERKAKERIDNLEMLLKSTGVHLSQHPVNA